MPTRDAPAGWQGANRPASRWTGLRLTAPGDFVPRTPLRRRSRGPRARSAPAGRASSTVMRLAPTSTRFSLRAHTGLMRSCRSDMKSFSEEFDVFDARATRVVDVASVLASNAQLTDLLAVLQRERDELRSAARGDQRRRSPNSIRATLFRAVAPALRRCCSADVASLTLFDAGGRRAAQARVRHARRLLRHRRTSRCVTEKHARRLAAGHGVHDRPAARIFTARRARRVPGARSASGTAASARSARCRSPRRRACSARSTSARSRTTRSPPTSSAADPRRRPDCHRRAATRRPTRASRR